MIKNDARLRVTLKEDKAMRLLTREFHDGALNESDKRVFNGPFDLRKSQGFSDMEKRLDHSRYIVESFSESSPFIDEIEIEKTMRVILDKSQLEGFIIVTHDAFSVLEVSKKGMGYREAMPAIGTLLTEIIQRSVREEIVSRPDELTLKGRDGEMVVIRYFQNLEWRFLLMAYAFKPCAYRMATNCVMQLCEPLLADHVYT